MPLIAPSSIELGRSVISIIKRKFDKRNKRKKIISELSYHYIMFLAITDLLPQRTRLSDIL